MFVVTRPGPSNGREPVIEDCNERFASRLGHEREDVLGRPLGEFYAPDSAESLYGGYERALRGEFDRAERELLARDGTVVHTVVHAVPRRDDTEGVAALYVDVTERKRREEHVQILNRVMRHNIRNDLNVLYGHTEMLLRSDDADVRESARVIGRTVERWLDLTEKAKEIEHLFEEAPAGTRPVGEIIHETQTNVELAYLSATVETEIDVDPDLPVSDRLHAAVEELCENGVKHDDDDEPRVLLRARRSDSGEFLELSVADRGPGVPEHERAILREGEETPLVHGSGLGFWLVRTVARRAGGCVTVDDRAGGGSVVTLRVPVRGALTGTE
ncbi:PAS domain S-box protein [Halopelagius longus]|nr:PAS domain S-box protein [Halopelagius longus]